MTVSVGILAALVALLAWGFGDYFVQRAARGIGSLRSLFFISLFGTLVLAPFGIAGLPTLVGQPQLILLLAVAVVISLFADYTNVEVLKQGKISVIEPVLGLELIFALVIGVAILREHISLSQVLLAIAVFGGIILTSMRNAPHRWWQRRRRPWILERGVVLAVLSALLLALGDIFTGLSSQATNPLMTIWIIQAFITVFILALFVAHGELTDVFRQARKFWSPVLLQSVLDNVAWIGFAYAVTTLPISITVAITESYGALATLLGIFWNKEKLQSHQYAGILLALAAAITLAALSAAF